LTKSFARETGQLSLAWRHSADLNLVNKSLTITATVKYVPSFLKSLNVVCLVHVWLVSRKNI